MIYKKNKKRLFRREVKSKKDFAWRESKRNPFSKNSKFSFKQKIEVILLILSIFGMLGVLFYHPYFHITNLEVNGLKRIEKTDFLEATYGVMNYKKFLILPTRSYLVLDKTELAEVLRLKFALSKIEINKKFPNSLIIDIEEEISTIIYDNGEEYSYLGLNGSIVEILRKIEDDEWNVEMKTVTTTNEVGEVIEEQREMSREHTPRVINVINDFGDYPIVYDKRQKQGSINEKVLEQSTVRGILDWYNLLTKKTNIPITYFILENELGDVYVKTKTGWELKIKYSERIESQFRALNTILEEKKIEEDNLQYIDLRFEDRVYWQ